MAGPFVVLMMMNSTRSGRYRGAPKCPHCGHALEGWSKPCAFFDNIWVMFLMVIAGLAAACFVVFTLLSWAFPYKDDPQTLVGVLLKEWHWFVSLLHRIW